MGLDRRLGPRRRRLPLPQRERGIASARRMKAEEVVDGRAQYFAVAEPAFGATRDAQEEGRALQREGHDAISGFTLGDRFVALRKPVPTADRVATFPLTAFQTWHAARYQRAEWVRDLADYAQPFLRRGIPVSDFITFWLDELDAHELPRALCAHIIAEAQREDWARQRAGSNPRCLCHRRRPARDGGPSVLRRAPSAPSGRPASRVSGFVNRAAPSIVGQLDEIT